jgi:hypothetical protein
MIEVPDNIQRIIDAGWCLTIYAKHCDNDGEGYLGYISDPPEMLDNAILVEGSNLPDLFKKLEQAMIEEEQKLESEASK